LDSAKYYAAKGMSQSQLMRNDDDFKDFVMVDAQINYYAQDYEKARDSLLKYIADFEGTPQAIKLYYLGKMEHYAKNDKLAKKYYLSIDSIISETQDPFSEVNDVYQQLVIFSNLEGDQQKRINYIEKLVHYDSVLASKQNHIIQQATVAYDMHYLKKQKQQAEKSLRKRSTHITILGSLGGVFLIFGTHFYLRSIKMKTKLKGLLDGPSMQNAPPKVITKHPPNIPASMREKILKQLDAFENSSRFLDKDLDRESLAQEFDTNIAYLSKIINHYKRMSFPTYLKDLRIRTAIIRLNEDPKVLKYDYQGLADLFGFRTAESFSKAFFERTKVYPSRFLKELKMRKFERHL
jgi:AraC-like DNA-binding protein